MSKSRNRWIPPPCDGVVGSLCVPLLATLCVVVSGCGASNNSTQQRINNSEMQRIESSLSAHKGVTRARLSYGGTEEPPGVSVDLNVANSRDVDVDQLRDEALRDVWLSRIQPLDGIAVTVRDESGVQSIPTVSYAFPNDTKQLVNKYGQRPVG